MTGSLPDKLRHHDNQGHGADFKMIENVQGVFAGIRLAPKQLRAS